MQKQKIQHRIDLLDISYLYLPWISSQFQEDYINKDKDNYILKYNYENRLIVRMGYNYSSMKPRQWYVKTPDVIDNYIASRIL